jgi:23S rRNA pseudouridine1911/1915/1917 synthase
MSKPFDNRPEPEIVWESGPCLAVNKPSGLLTQAPPGIDSLEHRLRQFLRKRDCKTANFYLVPCHRLDRPAAGLVIFARNVRAAQRIAGQFERREIRKSYWAIVSGHLATASDRWSDFMRKVPGDARSEIVLPEHPDAQFASLHCVELARGTDASLIEVDLETGRTHQIRLQTASRGHPILGDELYGSTNSFGPQTEDLRARWIALLARGLRFRHPMQDEMVVLTARLPNHWIEAMHELNLDQGQEA